MISDVVSGALAMISVAVGGMDSLSAARAGRERAGVSCGVGWAYLQGGLGRCASCELAGR